MIPIIVRTPRRSTPLKAVAAVFFLLMIYLVAFAASVLVTAIMVDLLGHLGHFLLGF